MKRNKLHIHWYPGHIAKAERQLKEKLSLVDVVIEVRDARIPISSGYNNIKELLGDKPRLLLLNKSDLTDKNELDKWIKYLEIETGCHVISTNTNLNKDFSQVIRISADLAEPKMLSLIEKGLLRRSVRVMVIGLPNVGKSSIINRLTKSSKTKIGAKAGVTRQQQWVRINNKLELLDTPGIIPTKQEDQFKAAKLAIVSSISENAYSSEPVANQLLMLFDKDKYRSIVLSYYNIDKLTLENIAISRNWVIKSGLPDIERTANCILKDFREGKIGKFILDELPE